VPDTSERVAYHEGYKLSGFQLFDLWKVAAFKGDRVRKVFDAETFEEACDLLRAWIDDTTHGQKAIDLDGNE
jgi:hypothetical protein